MYTLKLWNGKYDTQAKFIVQDNNTKKYTEFTPDRVNDVAWVDKDLTELPQYKGWEDFDNTPVDFLENVIM